MTKIIKTSTGLIIIFAVAVLFSGGVLAYFKVQDSVEKTDTTNSTPTTDATADWKTYTNSTYGYSIKYPSNYSAKEWADTIKTGAAAEPNKDLLSVIGFGSNSKLGDYEESITVTNDTLERRRTLACYELNTDRNEIQTTVAGIQAYKITCKDVAAPNDMAPDAQRKGGEKNINFVFQKGDYVYVISYIQSDLAKDTSNIFDDMVSAFQFTDVTADWKTYTNSTYGFSFKYPTDWTLETLQYADLLVYIGLNQAGYVRKEGTDMPNNVNFSLYESIAKLDSKQLNPSSLKDYLDKYAALSDPFYKNILPQKIGSINGYVADAGPNQFGGGRYYFAELPNKQIIKFWLFDEKKDQLTMDSILSTFQFTK